MSMKEIVKQKKEYSAKNDNEEDRIIIRKDKEYVNKKMNENEHLISSEMNSSQGFPKFLSGKKENDKFNVKMPFYESKKLNYKEKISFVKEI